MIAYVYVAQAASYAVRFSSSGRLVTYKLEGPAPLLSTHPRVKAELDSLWMREGVLRLWGGGAPVEQLVGVGGQRHGGGGP